MVLTVRIAAVFAVASAFALLTKEAAAVTADELLPSCELLVQQSKPVTPGTTWVPTEGEKCWDYFEALWDVSLLVDRRSCNSVPCNKPVLGICMSEGVTLRQIVRAFVTAAHQNPGQLNSSAAAIALAALRDAFPCSK
jgi:hypothetical protein